MAYEYLRKKVQDAGWVGKEILTITDEVRAIIDAPRDWLFDFAPFRAIADLPPFAWLSDFFDGVEDLPATCALMFMESAYSINRSYNSEKYVGQLSETGRNLLASFQPNLRDESLYFAAHKGYDTLRNHSSEIELLNIAVSDPGLIVGQMADAAVSKVTEIMSDMESAIEGAYDDTVKAAKRKYRDVKRVFESMQSGIVENVNRWLRGQKSSVPAPKFVGELPALVTGTPAIVSTVNVLSQITEWLLSNFLLKLVPLDMPVAALSFCVNSIVLKYLGGVGANACRFLSAGLLRGASAALPSIIAPSGLFAGCWALLMSLAPYLIFAALLVIAFTKFSTVLGQYLYVLGFDEVTESCAFTTAKLFDTNREEMFNVLKELKEERRREGMQEMSNLTGFAFNEKDELVMCVDLTVDPPVQIYGKAAMASKFLPFQLLKEEGPIGYLSSI